jgi:NAD(P)-dependent dehydrogenase (short-subunit alcohol dehydrogenase family)
VAERLAGRVCIVTGAAQGIGAAYARRLASEGADVAIVDLSRIDQAADVVADIEAMGRKALSLKADVTDPGQMTEVAGAVIGELGRIDCLVNNAGLMLLPTPSCRPCGSSAAVRSSTSRPRRRSLCPCTGSSRSRMMPLRREWILRGTGSRSG